MLKCRAENKSDLTSVENLDNVFCRLSQVLGEERGCQFFRQSSAYGQSLLKHEDRILWGQYSPDCWCLTDGSRAFYDTD